MEPLRTIFKRILFAVIGDGGEAERRHVAMTWTKELLSHAVRRDAAEIRIEPSPDRISVQLRIGWRFVNGPELDRTLVEDVAKVLKRLASLDETNTVRRQIGFVTIMLAGKPVRFKLSTLPFTHAEHLVVHFDKP